MLPPIAPALRPLSVGEIFDQAIRLYRRHFVTFVGIIAVVQIPYTLIQMVINVFNQSQLAQYTQSVNSSGTPDMGSMLSSQALTYLMIFIEMVLVQGIGTAALTRAVADNYLGRQTSIMDAYRRMGRSWLGLLGALILVSLLGAAFGIWLIVPCIGWLTGFGMLVFLGVSVRPLVPAVYVLENARATRSVRRAWDLAKRRFWWMLGFMMLLALFGTLLIYGPTTLLSLILQRAMGVDMLAPYANPQALAINLIISGLIGLVASLLYLPLQLTITTLAYFDLRVRTEGFDLSVLAADTSEDQAAVTQTAPTAPNESFIVWRDMGNFFALTLIGGVIYAIFVAIIMAIGIAAGGVGTF